MKIALRKKKLPSGNYSLFLDIRKDGNRIREYLNLKIVPGKTPQQKQQNKETLLIAEKVLSIRKGELINSTFGFKKDTSGTDFIHYFKQWADTYDKKDFRSVNACYKHFTDFIAQRKIKHLAGRELTSTFCEDFGNYLKTKLKHETPRDYFKKFRQVLNRAHNERIIDFRSPDVKVKYSFDENHIRKYFLTENDLKKLIAQPLPEQTSATCRAYILSLNTGIDFSTVKTLTFANIDNTVLDFRRPKTQKRNRIPLNQAALDAIGIHNKKEELIFKIPGNIATCIKHVRAWAASAGIKKKITWHSARHTFATLIIQKNDLKTTAELLGQSDLRQTQKYLHTIDERKKKAVDELF